MIFKNCFRINTTHIFETFVGQQHFTSSPALFVVHASIMALSSGVAFGGNVILCHFLNFPKQQNLQQ